MLSDESSSSPRPASRAKISTRDVLYNDLDVRLTGLLCWGEAQAGPGPGLLLIHGGAGLDGHAREQAHRYAELGYTVLACDMYGDAWRATANG